MLHQLQAARLVRGEHVGEVLGGVLELTAMNDGVVAALPGARGSGPPLWFTPEAEGSQVHKGAVQGDGAAPSEPVTHGR
jgi:hypothetical protein